MSMSWFLWETVVNTTLEIRIGVPLGNCNYLSPRMKYTLHTSSVNVQWSIVIVYWHMTRMNAVSCDVQFVLWVYHNSSRIMIMLLSFAWHGQAICNMKYLWIRCVVKYSYILELVFYVHIRICYSQNSEVRIILRVTFL